ncbi:hypothetical protein MRX96_031260 [Rhipicephalus microplus]
MGRHEILVNSRKGVQRKPWWDTEVKEALKVQRAANREHRSAIRNLPAEDCEQAWHKYLEVKRHMQQLVQRKIAESDYKKIKELTTPGRSRMQNFWGYVLTLDRKKTLMSNPPRRDDGRTVLQCQKADEYMQNVFGALAPVTAAETEVYIPPATGDAQETDREWKVARVALERALE